jgi:hypothetical protein
LEKKEIRTSRVGETEPVLLYQKKKVIQLANSQVAYFTCYCFQPGKRNIIKVTDDESAQLAYDWFKDRIKVLESIITDKSAKPIVKKNPKTESVEDLEKRIENLSPKSKAIHVANVTDEILTWVKSSNYKFAGDGHTLLIK